MCMGLVLEGHFVETLCVKLIRIIFLIAVEVFVEIGG